MKINPETKIHYLKTDPEYFQAVKKRKKKFEMRFNDRNYQVGEILVLQEFDRTIGEYTGANDLTLLVTYTLATKPFVPDGYICMSVNLLE